MNIVPRLRALRDRCRQSASVFVRDVGSGALEISHNSLALLGLAAVVAVVFVAGRPDIRERAETWALGWLQERHVARAEESGDTLVAAAEADAVKRATAASPTDLSRPQAAVAAWIARRYSVAPEPVARLVKEALARAAADRCIQRARAGERRAAVHDDGVRRGAPLRECG
jgi:hypothetical protein